MHITDDRTHEVRYYQRTLEFTGRDPEEYFGYSFKGKLWIPDTANTRYNHGEPITEITLTGNTLKKDGAPSENRVNKRYITPSHSSWGRGYSEEAPTWVLELFTISTPETSN